MIDPGEFFELLKENGIEFFTGVPDSLLKYFCAYITDNVPDHNNMIAANEGNAVGIAAGYHLATGEIPLVYMQNSGIGNSVNPLLSLVDREVYHIPMLLMIGWRGEPDKKDAVQHKKQGRITLDLLDTMEIPYVVLSDDIGDARKSVMETVGSMKEDGLTRAIVVRKGTFSEYKLEDTGNNYEMSREEAIEIIVEGLGVDDIVVSTTGKASRELYEIREKLGHGHKNDFLMVGSMGHASQIALGVALQKKDRTVVCLDGDGAVIMHMGGLSTVGIKKPDNYKHIVLNNYAHDSVGGQPTASTVVDFTAISENCGYRTVFTANDRQELKSIIKDLMDSQGPALLEVKVNKGSREDLSRPEMGHMERMRHFMDNLRG